MSGQQTKGAIRLSMSPREEGIEKDARIDIIVFQRYREVDLWNIRTTWKHICLNSELQRKRPLSF